jgi:chromate reductase
MPGKEQPFLGKPCAILTASNGPVGGSRVQYELRKILASIEAVVMPKPEVFVTLVTQKIDAEKGTLTDATTLDFMKKQMEAFKAFIQRLS